MICQQKEPAAKSRQRPSFCHTAIPLVPMRLNDTPKLVHRSTSLVHELYHWEDADDYRRSVGVIESADRKSVYTIYQRERARTALIDAGVNLQDMNQIRRELGDYAY